MKIYVTGSCGFIGKHLCVRLLEQGHIVIGIDNFTDFIYEEHFKRRNQTLLQSYQNYIHITNDIQSENFIQEHEPDIVIHLAAHANVRKSFVQPVSYVENNVVGTCKIIQDVLRCKTQPLLLYASSSSVYGTNTKVPFAEEDSTDNIISIYALSKHMCEEMAGLYSKISGLKAIGLRFFTVYGPGGRPDMSIYNFLRKIEKGDEIVIYGDGSMQRDFTYVEDIVDGILGCTQLNLEKGEHRIYNLGNNNPITLHELIQSCETVVGKKANIVHKPIPVGEVPITYADITKANTDIQFSPKMKFMEGLYNTYEWIKEMSKDI
jgi:UDP-glucuronate 4-epimerase